MRDRWTLQMAAAGMTAVLLLAPLVAQATNSGIGNSSTGPLPGGSERGDQEQLSTTVLWDDDDHSDRAVFIPQRVLQTTAIDELPMPPWMRGHLRSEVKKFSAERWGYRCNRMAPMRQGEDDSAESFEGLLDGYNAVIEGEIVHVEPGWSPWTNDVAEAVYLETVSILSEQKEGAAPPLGTIVGVIFPGGRTIVGNTTLCMDRREGQYEPVVGERVLVAGTYRATEPPYFEAGIRFPVRDGHVLAQPYGGLRADDNSRSLEELRRSLRHERGEGRRKP